MPQAVAGWEARYGQPLVLDLSVDLTDYEMAIVAGSARTGRSHDITLFIFDGGRLALIRKPLLPAGAFRAPSGGLYPWETLEIGAQREALEETGLEIELDRYLIRVRARFTGGDQSVSWTSHVFSAIAVGGELNPLDKEEILDAKYGDLAELQGTIREKMLATGLGLLRYRVDLTDAVVAALQNRTGC